MPERRHRGGLTVAWRALVKQLVAHPSVSLTIAGSVFTAVLFLATVPRSVETVTQEALHHTLTDPPVQQRNIALNRTGRISASVPQEPFRNIDQFGQRFSEREMEPSIQEVLVDQTYLIDSPEFLVGPVPEAEPGPFPTFFRFRYQELIDEHATLVGGRWPEPQDDPFLRLEGTECPDEVENIEEYQAEEDVDCELTETPVFEVAVTQQTLDAFHFGLDEMVLLSPNPQDPLNGFATSEELDYELALVVSGLIELSDPSLDYWYDEPRLHRPSVTENPDFRLVFATALMSPTDYQRLYRFTSPAEWRYTWHYFVEPELVDATSIDRLAIDLTNLQIAYRGFGFQTRGQSISTLLPSLINSYLEERDTTFAFMSISLAGALVVAAVVILELAGLSVMRQRRPLILTRNRGASRPQMLLTRLYQSLLLIAPPAIAGLALSEYILPDTDGLIPSRTTAFFAAVAALLFVAASLPLTLPRLGALQRDEPLARARPRVRLVVEVLVTVIAVGAVVLLRRRGQIDSRDTPEFDVLLAFAPALIGVAIAILAMRLYPYLIGSVSRLTSGNRGVVAFVGFKRVLQQPPVARIPIVVIALSVSVAVFSILVRDSINEGQVDTSWQQVGANYRIGGRSPGVPLSNLVDLSEVDDVNATAGGFRDPTAHLKGKRSANEFLAIDANAYPEVVAGTAGDPSVPPFMLSDPAPAVGTVDLPLPVVVSRSGWAPDDPPALGDVFILDLERLKPVVVVREVRDTWPGVRTDRAFVVADINALDTFSAPIDVGRTDLFVDAPKSAGSEIEATIAGQNPSARTVSRFEALADLSDRPLARAIDVGLLATAGFATVLAAVAAVSSLALSAAMRIRDLGYLRTMGLMEDQAVALTVLEQVPMLIVSASFGGLSGALTVWILEPALALGAFTGGLVDTAVELKWPLVAILVAGLTVVLGLAIVIFIFINRSSDLGKLLRVGDE